MMRWAHQASRTYSAFAKSSFRLSLVVWSRIRIAKHINNRTDHLLPILALIFWLIHVHAHILSVSHNKTSAAPSVGHCTATETLVLLLFVGLLEVSLEDAFIFLFLGLCRCNIHCDGVDLVIEGGKDGRCCRGPVFLS